MCGITGYVGPRQAAEVLLEGLSKLEYRGYDSAGIAVRGLDGKVRVVKAKGRLRMLSEKIDGGKALTGNIGIGHTRWATHGEPSETNAHPHISGPSADDCAVVGVHNGIIENYQELKDKLVKAGYEFYSQTDTEVAVKLADYYYRKTGDPVAALSKMMLRIRGSYALALLFNDFPDRIWTARKDSPMIIGTGEGEQIQKELSTITWDDQAAERGGYEHFMIKEIHEQPRAVRDTLNSLISSDGKSIDISATGLDEAFVRTLTSIQIVACGSAWHVGMEAQYVFEDLARIPVRVELASEFRYRNPILSPGTLVIVISQSGETADSLAALREARSLGARTLAIVNVVGSSIAREADHVLYTLAGPEIAVATTKAYCTQLAAAFTLAVEFSRIRGQIDNGRYVQLISELQSIPDKIAHQLEDKERIQWFAAKYSNARDAFFIGRGIDYAVCLEGSLKMKEVSYVHSEAYAAGELKHGTISLIEPGTLLVGVLTQNALFGKTVSNMVECKTRGAYLMAVTTQGHYDIEDVADFTIYVPKVDEHFIGILAIVPLQLLGYYTSVVKGLDVDKPRNLAKSVTVE